ncbi:hypothetical protein KI387_029821, partial [Taxus chinensis]
VIKRIARRIFYAHIYHHLIYRLTCCLASLCFLRERFEIGQEFNFCQLLYRARGFEILNSQSLSIEMIVLLRDGVPTQYCIKEVARSNLLTEDFVAMNKELKCDMEWGKSSLRSNSEGCVQKDSKKAAPDSILTVMMVEFRRVISSIGTSQGTRSQQ